jgi:hypothetical protein
MMNKQDSPPNTITPPITLACRRCGKITTWQGNEFRPFCSERCKQIDLGAWANEDYTIPTTPSFEEDL